VTDRFETVHEPVAVPPLPLRLPVVQIVVDPSFMTTVCVGVFVPLARVTVAVNVTALPYAEGLEEAPNVVVVLAVAEFTVMPNCVPVIDAEMVSAAVMDRNPAVFSVALKVAAPLSLLLWPLVKV
jgi:hypothetical protein